uniref:Uncharacterized protein n=1 Tax=Cacopsylla melanoneura TaxID=428564 RepID=A0A8D9A6U8_9HEMI
MLKCHIVPCIEKWHISNKSTFQESEKTIFFFPREKNRQLVPITLHSNKYFFFCFLAPGAESMGQFLLILKWSFLKLNRSFFQNFISVCLIFNMSTEYIRLH